jgi:predicted HAD superfamily Cof-like phosphohydrolase
MDFNPYDKSKTVMDMVKEFSTILKQEPNPDLYEGLVKEEYVEWKIENDIYDDPHNELKELADLIYVCYSYANSRGWDIDEAIRRVHNNNIGRCIQPDGSIVRRADGKILKNRDFPKVKLGDLI